jgi:hypothetical protein
MSNVNVLWKRVTICSIEKEIIHKKTKKEVERPHWIDVKLLRGLLCYFKQILSFATWSSKLRIIQYLLNSVAIVFSHFFHQLALDELNLQVAKRNKNYLNKFI